MFSTLRLFAVILTLLTFAFSDATAQTRGRFPDKMTVTVVDESGKPITNATGFHHFLEQYVEFKVDENGVFVIAMNEDQKGKRETSFISIKAEGYGPYLARFEEDPIIPETFTVVLKPAQKTGGIVVDEEGNSVQDVDVELWLNPETGYKLLQGLGTSIKTKTNSEGQWSFFQFPATPGSFPDLTFVKEGFMPLQVVDIPASRFNPDAAGKYHDKIVLERGYVFSGKVVDETGKPIEGARLQLGYDTKRFSRTKRAYFDLKTFR
jgi:protocatechuate 3,4-dioxygenase beta subunit